MTENKEKEWVVLRLLDLHSNLHEDLDNEIERVKVMFDKLDNDITTKRNYYLSGAGVGLTILIGFLSTNQIGIELFQKLFLVDIIIGITVFICFSRILNYYNGLAKPILNEYLTMREKILYSKGFLLGTITNDLDQTELQSLKKYTKSIARLFQLSYVPMLLILNKKLESRGMINEIRHDLNKTKLTIEKLFKTQKVTDEIVENLNLPEELLDYAKEMYQKYKKLKLE